MTTTGTTRPGIAEHHRTVRTLAPSHPARRPNTPPHPSTTGQPRDQARELAHPACELRVRERLPAALRISATTLLVGVSPLGDPSRDSNWRSGSKYPGSVLEDGIRAQQRSLDMAAARCDPDIGGMHLGRQRVPDESASVAPSGDKSAIAQLGDSLRREEDALAGHSSNLPLEPLPSSNRQRGAEDPGVDRDATHVSMAA